MSGPPFEYKADAVVWGMLFVGLGVLIIWNLPPDNAGWFLLVAGFFVFVGIFGVATTLFPPGSRRRR